ncbi:MAG: hypothetical protein NXY57DRAFT_589063 [Lentinula lateritia]|uniref:HMG box domain-containing protein n=1 Tax=Lentinula lateritia TaxID=40482 RepID=A0ABQ8VUS6_9AGAR|nr:MAG: hypothetical protein NXY57DRAFT_589063 [Lentinula lateritia]KAJ4499347.1 hypothetical protein C8R41DRAFT_815364 [Lentinula lateritia]
MSTQIFQFYTPTETEVNRIVGYDYMATSKDHNLDEKLPPSHPVSTQFAPIFSPSLEYRGPDSTSSLKVSRKSSARPLAPRKGSPRRETHIPRPRNPFMIFRSEYHAQSKITTDVERDHRHISRIVGYLWNNMSEEDKAPYRLMAEKEKAEHQRKYPGYRFCPGTRTSKPVKRNVKRNGQTDLVRAQKVAELLKAGLQGHALESAVKDIDSESLEGSSPPAEDFSRSPSSSPSTQPSPSLPDIHGWLPSKRDPVPVSPVFRSPLLAPAPTQPLVSTRPIRRRVPERPIMDSLRPDPPSIVPNFTYSSQSSQLSLSHMIPAHPEVYQPQLHEASVVQGYNYDSTPNLYNACHNEPQFIQHHTVQTPSYHDATSSTEPYKNTASLCHYPDDGSSNVPLNSRFPFHQSLFASAQDNLFSGFPNEYWLYQDPAGQIPDQTNPLTWDPMQFMVNM